MAHGGAEGWLVGQRAGGLSVTGWRLGAKEYEMGG